MLDTIFGPVTFIHDQTFIQMRVTHIGNHNKFRYNDFETIFIAQNYTGYNPVYLVGRRIKCDVHYRDAFNRVYANITLD